MFEVVFLNIMGPYLASMTLLLATLVILVEAVIMFFLLERRMGKALVPLSAPTW